MNRIRELRKARGWTAEELAARVGTSHNQITRLETGARRLNSDWIEKISAALQVTPAELLSERPARALENDIGPAGPSYATVAAALARKNMGVYRVVSDAVIDAGIEPESIVTIDKTDEAIASVRNGDVVMVEVLDHGNKAPAHLLRQILLPRTLITNKPGIPVAITVDDPRLDLAITGVVIRD